VLSFLVFVTPPLRPCFSSRPILCSLRVSALDFSFSPTLPPAPIRSGNLILPAPPLSPFLLALVSRRPSSVFPATYKMLSPQPLCFDINAKCRGWKGVASRSYALLRALCTKSEKQTLYLLTFPHSFLKLPGCGGFFPFWNATCFMACGQRPALGLSLSLPHYLLTSLPLSAENAACP
jgi:hypothetical protein